MDKSLKGDMTQGNTAKILVTFAVPMVLGNIFQQLYNTTDAIIVGRFIGKNALAAVGVANPIMSIAIFFIVGICLGTSVLMSQLFGAGQLDVLKKEISTGLIVGTAFSLVMSLICILISRWVLVATGTPEEILNDADLFLKIIFGGLIFSFLYNFYSSALRSIGDSKTPLIFLIISCILNAILAAVLVVVFKLGIAGSAIATVISQGVASVLCIAYVYIKIPLMSLRPKELVVDKSLLNQTIQYSWVTALQQTWLYIGRLLVQDAVNPFGTSAIAAYNSATRVDSFVLAPGDSFSASASTYTAQNKGAGKWERIIEGYKKSTLIITVYSVATAVIIFLGAEWVMKLFVASSETEVVEIGVKYLKLMSLFYILSGFNNIFQGFFRGVGKLRITLIATVLQITARVGLSYAFAPYFGVSGVAYAIGIGWVLMASYEGLKLKGYFKELRNSNGL